MEYRSGGAGATGLVLLPGSAGGGDAYFRLIDRVGAEFHWLAIDYPIVADLDELLTGLLEILDLEGVYRWSMVGGSFGGMVAQALLLADPSRVDRVVLNSTGAPSPQRAESNRRWQPVIRCIPVVAIRGLLKAVVRKIGKRIGAEREFWIGYYCRAVDAITRADLESKYRVQIDFDSRFAPRLSALESWGGSLLITEGDADTLANAKTRGELLAAYPQAEVRSFEGAGHGVSLERPEEWAEAVTEFLTGPSPG